MNSTAPAISQNIDLSFKDKIEFKNVSFQYEEKGLTILENISIKIPSGKNIAIIGPSGSGKSTFLDLLLGFLSPKHGEILVDGLQMTKDNINSIRYNFAFVPQKVYLVEDTLKNNILFGSQGAHYTEADLNNAIISSKLEEVIKKLPDGLETIVSESNQLVSGGEKQSIGIARATLKEAGVVILDEATNAMDHDLEEATMKNLLDGSKFKTVICITHKPALLKYFDEIYVFDSGKITASGSYEKIIANNDFLEAMMKDTH
jgi:ABC-type bacteriocin/lantibiotic exporter with double-glycine peptidase domain